jgi:hypothetical protein
LDGEIKVRGANGEATVDVTARVEPPHAPPPPPEPPSPRPGPPEQRGRRKAWITIGALVALVILAIAVVALLLSGGNDDNRATSPSTTLGGSEIPTGDGDGAAAASNVTVPDVRGQHHDDATKTLEKLGLNVDETAVLEARVSIGLVVDTDPGRGTSAPRGSTVQLFVSACGVTVPDVRGQSQTAATASLGSKGLDVHAVSQSSSAAAGLALGTNPPAGTTVLCGSSVTLIVSSGSTSPRTTEPSARTTS